MNGNGRDDAFLSECVERYSDMVFRLAYQYLFNRQDAEDVVQDVFFALVRRSELGRFNGDEHVKAWLIRVTVNKSINAAAYLEPRARIIPGSRNSSAGCRLRTDSSSICTITRDTRPKKLPDLPDCAKTPCIKGCLARGRS